MKKEDFIKLWEKVPTEEELENARIYWNMRAVEFNEQSRDNCVEIQEILEQRGFQTSGKRMLDIGCGPGKCAIRFSREFSQVVGVDISDQMVDYARENAQNENAENVAFFAAAWEHMELEERGWENHFDVVVASMTPGISNVEELEKMCRASRDLCMLSSFVHRRDLKLELEEHLGISKPGSVNKNKIYLVFNILWYMGYYPEVYYTDAKIHREYQLSDALRLYSRQLSLDESQADKAKHFLQERAIDGVLYQDYTAKIGWVCWNVKK